jgi:hypothetical protein
MKYIQIIKPSQLYFKDIPIYFLLQVNLSYESIYKNRKKLLIKFYCVIFIFT